MNEKEVESLCIQCTLEVGAALVNLKRTLKLGGASDEIARKACAETLATGFVMIMQKQIPSGSDIRTECASVIDSVVKTLARLTQQLS